MSRLSVSSLLHFIGIEDESIATAAGEIPKLPSSSGRYRHMDTSWVDADVESKLEELGYSLQTEEEGKG